MAACWVLLFSVSSTRLATAAPLEEARVSQVIQDVRLLEAHGARPAVVNDKLTLERALRTGKESRAELTFSDLTITRLGANTIFSLKARTREVDLRSGTVLLAVPSGAPPVRANTTAVTAAVTGGTALLGTGPPTKFMVLEGIGTIYPLGHPEKAVTVHGGEMVIAEGGRISKPEEFDVKMVMETSLLIVDFPPLPNLSLIQDVINQQLAEESPFWTIAWPPAWYWNDVIDVTDLNANANPIVLAVRIGTPSPTPAPTPSKTGTPATITSPNPYLITSGTVITTDPSITTNGVTDFGKIYRGPLQDGAFTLWAFGSTSAFDNAIGLDAIFAEIGNLPLAAFKFQSLSLVGNPTIDTSNGTTHLALIGVDGITSGPPGGPLTFTGLDALLLATVNGSINLTSDVSFQGLRLLAMYARGAGSNLTLNSQISNIGLVALAAENSIQLTNPGTMSVGAFEATAGNNLRLQIGGSLLLNGPVDLNTRVLPGTTLASGANLSLNVTGDYTNNSTTDSSRLRVGNEGAHIGTGGDIGVNIGGNLTPMSDFDLIVQNTNGRIDNGGDISLRAGSINVAGALNATLDNTGGLIGSDATIDVGGQGDFSANSLTALINDRQGGSIGSSAALTFNVRGALSIANDATLLISTRNDGTIGGDAQVNVTAGSLSTGALFDDIYNYGAGQIGRDAIISLNVSNSFTATGNAEFLIQSFGGNITRDASISVNASDISAPSLTAQINNSSAGSIGGNASITLDLSGGLTVAPELNVLLANYDESVNPAGHIAGRADISLTTRGDVTADFASIALNNRGGGVIDSGVTVTVDIGGALTTTENGPDFLGNSESLSLAISSRYDNNTAGSLIGGDATLLFHSDSASIGGLLAVNISDIGGTINGNAVLNFGVTHDITIQESAAWEILNDSGTDMNAASPIGGTIHGSATLRLSADNLTADSLLFVDILNENGGVPGSGGTIDSDANITFNLTGNLRTQTAYFQILNEVDAGGTTGGTIGGNATIDINAANIRANSLVAQIDNMGGSIGGSAAINMNVSGNVRVATDATVAIFGSDTAGSAAINFNGGNYDATGTFLSYIDGNGTITFSNATAHADVLKAGVFGANGVLNIGGGMLSADSELKLYAPGSNGQLNFVSNVTLGGNSLKILAADSVTIFNNVVVTIGGPNLADVFTNHANYTGFGGNGTTTGTFAGAGANRPQPLANAPPFNSESKPILPHGPTSPSQAARFRDTNTPKTIDVSNTNEVLSLLDEARVDRNGKIATSHSTSSNNLKNPSRMNTNRLLRTEHQMLNQQTRNRDITRVGVGKRAL